MTPAEDPRAGSIDATAQALEQAAQQCGKRRDGSCARTGTEWCRVDCPYRGFREPAVKRPLPLFAPALKRAIARRR